MNKLTDGFTAFLDEDRWNYKKEERPKYFVFRFGYTIQDGSELKVLVTVREEIGVVCLLAKLDCLAPPRRRPAVAEFLCRANDGLLVGGFDFKFDDGEVQYRTGIDLEGTTASSATFRNLLHSSLATAARYYPGLLKVISEELSPKAAVAMIESPA